MTKTIQKIEILTIAAVVAFIFSFEISAATHQIIVFQSADSTIQSQEESKTSAFANVDYIEFESTVVTEENFEELNAEFDGKLSKSALNSSTLIVLIMNNHRDNLTAFNYKELSTLDGESAQEWQQLRKGMGGHHVSGVLNFPKVKNPQSLVITGLPVGDVVLTY